MTYEQFKAAIQGRLAKDIPDPKTIHIHEVYKNNGTVLDGLIILENSANASPTLYLNYYYSSYEEGETFSAVYTRLLQDYRDNRPDGSIDPEFFRDFGNVRDHISFKLIHYEKNRALLADTPHLRFLDLAIVFYHLLSLDGELGRVTMLIRKAHAENWDTTPRDLYRTAKQNAMKLLPATLQDLHQVAVHLTASVKTSEDGCHVFFTPPEDPVIPLYLLTNKKNLFGASCMLYNGILKNYAEQMKADFYIIPSSIHEVLLLPVTSKDQYDRAHLDRLVREVNREAVDPEEVLSDHVYFYSAKEDRILM